MELIDISPVLSERTAVWPGDVALSRTVALSLAGGDNLELSSIQATVHLGAHADAPSHYAAGGASIEQRPLELYYGPCEVIEVAIGRGQRVGPQHLPHPPGAERLLIRTDTFPDPEVFNEDFAALSPELIVHLAGHGVRLVGIDTPSVDLCHDRELITHNTIATHDLAILEGLVLTGVAPGRYTLIALPLRLQGADASPVRAVLAR